MRVAVPWCENRKDELATNAHPFLGQMDLGCAGDCEEKEQWHLDVKPVSTRTETHSNVVRSRAPREDDGDCLRPQILGEFWVGNGALR